MSRSRLVMRIGLVLLLAGMGFMAFRAFQKDTPDYMMSRAEAAAKDGDLDGAIFHLRRLLQRHPDNTQAHYRLSRLMLALASKMGAPDTYGGNQAALDHLIEAGRLAPDDLALQKLVLAAQLDAGRVKSSRALAEKIMKLEPDNADAVFTLTWAAVTEKKHLEAERLLRKVLDGQIKTRHPFQTLRLAADYYFDIEEGDNARDMLDRLCNLAAATKADDFNGVSERDRLLLPRVLGSAVISTDSPMTARRRFLKLADAFDSLEAGGWLTANYLSVEASRLFEAVKEKLLRGLNDPVELGHWEGVDERLETLRTKAIEQEGTDLLIYRQSAISRAAHRNRPGAIEVAQAGLEEVAKREQEKKEGKKTVRPIAGEIDQEAIKLDLHLIAARQLLAMRRFTEAQKHIDALMEDQRSKGWSYLLAGYAALESGELEKGLACLRNSEGIMGQLPTIRLAQADALLRLGRWREAQTILDTIRFQQNNAQNMDPETMTREQKAAMMASPTARAQDLVSLAQVQANLEGDNWPEAQRYIIELADSDVAPRAQALAIRYLWKNNHKSEAEQMLRQARAKHPGDRTLLQLQTSILEKSGRAHEATDVLEDVASSDSGTLGQRAMYFQHQLKHGKAAEVIGEIDKELQEFDADSKEAKALRLFKAQAYLAVGRPVDAIMLAEPLCGDQRLGVAAAMLATVAGHRLGQVARVEAALQAAGEADPNNRVLSLLRGQHALALGKGREAVDHLAKIVEVTSMQQRVSASLIRALLVMAEDESAGAAIDKVNELLAASPENLILETSKAQLLLQLGRRQEGLALLERLKNQRPDHLGIVRLQASALLADGQYEAAMQQAGVCLEKSPGDPRTLELLARAAVGAEQYETALRTIDVLYEAAPQRWDLVLMRADVLERMGRTEAGINLLREFVAGRPDLATGYAALAAAQKKAGKDQDALATLERGAKEVPESAILNLRWLEQLIEMGQLDAANALANKLGGSNPTAQQCVALGTVFQNRGALADAKEWLERALGKATIAQKPSIQLRLGDLEMANFDRIRERRHLDNAVIYYQQVLATEPTNLVAANNYAWLLTDNLHDPEEAIRVLRRATEDQDVVRLNPSVIHTFAVAYHSAKLLPEARKLLEAALQEKPNQPVLLFQLGLVLKDQGEGMRARMMLQQAIEIGLDETKTRQAERALELLGGPAGP